MDDSKEIKKLFSEAILKMSHLEYTTVIENEKVVKDIISKLRPLYPDEISHFGFDKLSKVIKLCKDRKVLYKLINQHITFD